MHRGSDGIGRVYRRTDGQTDGRMPRGITLYDRFSNHLKTI